MDDLILYGQNKKRIETLVNLVRTFRKHIRMGFSITKCVARSIISRSEGIQVQMMKSKKVMMIEGDINTWVYWKLIDLGAWK